MQSSLVTVGGNYPGIEVSNPFHPGPGDSYQVIAPRAEPASFPATAGEASFTAALRHINAVLASEEEPRLLAAGTALATAQALHDLAASLAHDWDLTEW